MTTTEPHILMIDDDDLFLRLFGGKLASAGFNMLYAQEAHAGRELARRFHPDLILLDMRMPNTDGFAIAQYLRNESLTKDIPIMFLTNEDLSPETESFIKAMWAVDYIHKSIDLNAFVERIKEVLQKFKPPQKTQTQSEQH